MIVNSEHELLAQKHVFADLIRTRLNPAFFAETENDRLKMVFDLEMHLAFLGEAIRCKTPRIFSEYAVWTNQLLITSGGNTQDFRVCLLQIDVQIQKSCTGTWVEAAHHCIAEALFRLDEIQPVSDCYFKSDNPHKQLAEAFLNDCLNLHRNEAMEKIHHAANNGTSVNDIYMHIITPVMHELGRLWHLNKISVGHEHYCTAIAQMVMAQLLPWIFDGSPKKSRLVSACVAGELHEIGARMVSDLFEMNGWDTVFLGADVPVESVIDTVIQHNACVLAISVTLAAHLSAVSEMILRVRADLDCVKVKILVGGAAFSTDDTLWQRLGADGWAVDIDDAIALANKWAR
jgi:methanogenic corrinoid protein MtbC1